MSRLDYENRFPRDVVLSPLLDRHGVEASIMLVLFAHNLLFVRRRDRKKAVVCQGRIGSFQATIDDSSQVDSAVARVHSCLDSAVEPG